MALQEENSKADRLDRRDRMLSIPSCNVPVGELSEYAIERLKQRQKKALEKYGYLSNRES